MKSTFSRKKIFKMLALLMVFCMMIGVVACGKDKQPNDETPSTEVNNGTESDDNAEDEGTEGDVNNSEEDETGNGDGTSGDETEGDGDKEDETEEDSQGQGDEDAGNVSGVYTDTGFIVSDPDNLRGLSEERVGFGSGAAKDGKPSVASTSVQEYFDSIDFAEALVWDNRTKDEKVLYLTFDCGYEYNNNTPKLLDILKEKDVTAAFFCTLPFLKECKDTAGRIINEGHILGNHSTTHPSFASISRTKMAEELFGVHKWLMDNYNYSSSYVRPPMGEYSESSLELCTSLGYRTVLWSFAHVDWETDNQPGKEKTLQTLIDRLHPGEVILLHSVSNSNVEALGDFIDYAREQGYTFKSLDDYPW